MNDYYMDFYGTYYARYYEKYYTYYYGEYYAKLLSNQMTQPFYFSGGEDGPEAQNQPCLDNESDICQNTRSPAPQGTKTVVGSTAQGNTRPLRPLPESGVPG